VGEEVAAGRRANLQNLETPSKTLSLRFARYGVREK